MQRRPVGLSSPSRPEGSSANVTSAIGMTETAGHLRARRHFLFTRTIMWLTGLICIALLLASLAQAWSNNDLMRQVQVEQQTLQQTQNQNTQLQQAAKHYNDPAVLESEARQQLDYMRPGEYPVVIVGAQDQVQQSGVVSKKASVQQGYWLEWWQIFFKN